MLIYYILIYIYKVIEHIVCLQCMPFSNNSSGFSNREFIPEPPKKTNLTKSQRMPQ